MESDKRNKVLNISCLFVFATIFVTFAAWFAHMLISGLPDARPIRAEYDIKAITTALRTYEMITKQMPTTEQGLQALVKKPTIEPIPRQWTQLLEEVPRDPWKQPYVYRNPGRLNPEGFDLYSLGSEGIESDDDIDRKIR